MSKISSSLNQNVREAVCYWNKPVQGREFFSRRAVNTEESSINIENPANRQIERVSLDHNDTQLFVACQLLSSIYSLTAETSGVADIKLNQIVLLEVLGHVWDKTFSLTGYSNQMGFGGGVSSGDLNMGSSKEISAIIQSDLDCKEASINPYVPTFPLAYTHITKVKAADGIKKGGNTMGYIHELSAVYVTDSFGRSPVLYVNGCVGRQPPVGHNTL